MSSSWTDLIQNKVYTNEISPYLEIIRNGINIDFNSEKEWKEYMESGGWKKRAGGKILAFGEDKITHIKGESQEIFIIRNPSYSWKKWMKTIGSYVEIK